MKAVFDTKPTSIYDDDIFSRYHFPKRYLRLVESTVGDWVVLRRPRADGGNLAYFATARVSHIEADPSASGMSYARLADFLEFGVHVPWRDEGRYAEEALRNVELQFVGRFLRGKSVRELTEEDFRNIIATGLSKTLNPAIANRFDLPPAPIQDLAQSLAAPVQERLWRIEQCLTNRVVRDANFRLSVCDAYENTCAFTGLRISDDRERPESQAAHIWAVSEGGPDVVQNGLALSATVHWLFDRYVVSLTDDFHILVRDNAAAETLARMSIVAGKSIILPKDRSLWPHPGFISKHRSRFLNKQAGLPAGKYD